LSRFARDDAERLFTGNKIIEIVGGDFQRAEIVADNKFGDWINVRLYNNGSV
jgi:hypothetical protein